MAARGIQPDELWADRGYASNAIDAALRQRQIEPRISKPHRRGEPIPAGTPTREVWRGKKRRLKTPDPHARHRRIATRRDRKADTYLAFLHLGMILILARSF